MAIQIVPTEGNLPATKKSLSPVRIGLELMDCKCNILIREMMALIERANEFQDKIDRTCDATHAALQVANVTLGICDKITEVAPCGNNPNVAYRSVMGVEVPMMSLERMPPTLSYGPMDTNAMMDDAYLRLREVKYLTAGLVEVENSVHRLVNNAEETQKRANALKNIIIPRLEEIVRFITDTLEEKDREEFSRLKVAKRQKTAG